MGTLSSELAPHAGRLSARPRIYADANVPSWLVEHMRTRLRWDVLFVLEDPDLRRARDLEHFRLARQLQRTLVTLDRDYLDDRRFPPLESGGVLVIAGPDERGLSKLLRRPEAGPPVLWRDLRGSLFCFSVNECASEYAAVLRRAPVNPGSATS